LLGLHPSLNSLLSATPHPHSSRSRARAHTHRQHTHTHTRNTQHTHTHTHTHYGRGRVLDFGYIFNDFVLLIVIKGAVYRENGDFYTSSAPKSTAVESWSLEFARICSQTNMFGSKISFGTTKLPVRGFPLVLEYQVPPRGNSK